MFNSYMEISVQNIFKLLRKADSTLDYNFLESHGHKIIKTIKPKPNVCTCDSLDSDGVR